MAYIINGNKTLFTMVFFLLFPSMLLAQKSEEDILNAEKAKYISEISPEKWKTPKVVI